MINKDIVEYAFNNPQSPYYSYPDTPTAKARWVLNYVDFQIYSKAYKTNLFH